MKKVLTIIITLSVLFCLQGFAQKPGDSKGISDNSTIKGKRLLRKEMKAHNATTTLAVKNERKARKAHKTGTVNRHKAKTKQIKKQNKKNRNKREKAYENKSQDGSKEETPK